MNGRILADSKYFVIKKIRILKKLSQNQTTQIQKLQNKNFIDADRYNKENQKILHQLYKYDQKIKDFPKNHEKKIKKLLIKCNRKNEIIINFYQNYCDLYHNKLNLIEYKIQFKRFIKYRLWI